jgi:hypothetical protein
MNKQDWVLSCLDDFQSSEVTECSKLLRRLIAAKTRPEREDILASARPQSLDNVVQEIVSLEGN